MFDAHKKYMTPVEVGEISLAKCAKSYYGTGNSPSRRINCVTLNCPSLLDIFP